jgi:hypothetical protein
MYEMYSRTHQYLKCILEEKDVHPSCLEYSFTGANLGKFELLQLSLRECAPLANGCTMEPVEDT